MVAMIMSMMMRMIPQGLPTANLVVTRLVGLLLLITVFHTIINRWWWLFWFWESLLKLKYILLSSTIGTFFFSGCSLDLLLEVRMRKSEVSGKVGGPNQGQNHPSKWGCAGVWFPNGGLSMLNDQQYGCQISQRSLGWSSAGRRQWAQCWQWPTTGFSSWVGPSPMKSQGWGENP